VQQCAAPTLQPSREATLDLRIVSKAALSADPSSVPPQAAGYRIITGVLFENSPEGRRPLPGAFVDVEPIGDFPAAITYSDPQGRYLLCGIPDDSPAALGASVNINRVAY